MRHKVTCAGCGKVERIEVEVGTNKHEKQGWYYYTKINIHGCQTDKYIYVNDEEHPKPLLDSILDKLKKVPNPCYNPKVKPKYVELWFCKDCE